MKILLALVFIALPGSNGGGIGFDDLRYDRTFNLVLVPAGRTGNLVLIDAATRKVEAIGGFTKVATYESGHGQSVTSVDPGAGFWFATDRDDKSVSIVNVSKRRIASGIKLEGTPDYVRFAAPTREVWVTEPSKKGIEVFELQGGPVLKRRTFISVPGGPESLVVDAKRGRAYTHDWKKTTHAIDLKSHEVVATWDAGCAAPRGIALDEARGYLLIGCEDGTATALDVTHDGKLLGSVKSGAGVDIIAYDAKRAHLYVPGDESATMAIVAVGDGGALKVLGTEPTVKGAHCVTTDEQGHAYVCDPQGGRIIVIEDKY
jgi:DNA-binding beta-propeller fold protein YncE